jgi:nitrous oxidase accessory protein
MTRLARALVGLGALLLLGVYATPLWRVHLLAPQYPEGIGMSIGVHSVTGLKENDLANINGLNHYIGMKPIDPDAIPELRFMPWIVAALVASGLGVAALGRRRLVYAWLGAFVLVGAVGLADFWRWEYSYGHDLDLEHAIIIVPGMSYQPPLIGSRQLLNFTATSLPAAGTLFIALAFALGVASLFVGRGNEVGDTPRRERRHGQRRRALGASAALSLALAALPAQLLAQSAEFVVSPTGQLRTVSDAVARAPAHSTIVVRAGVYREPLITIDKPLHLVGDGWPTLDGQGAHSIVLVRSDDVTVRGFRLANTGVNDVDDRAAIIVSGAHDCAVEHNRVDSAMFGIYLANVTGCRVADNVLRAHGRTEAMSGNGIHLWTARNVRIERNHITGHRDGIYFEFVHDSWIRDNLSERNQRYGLHFMFSDGCHYLSNTFRANGSGVAVMFSKQVEMRDNQFVDNWGPAAYGLLLKEIANSRVEGNTFRHNTTALVADGANRLVASFNTFAANGWAIRLAASTEDARFSGNDFLGNTFDVASNSSRQSSVFNGNYWDAYGGYDLNGDGIGDVPHHPVSLFSMIAERHPPVLVLLHSAFATLVDVAERALPTLTPETLVDRAPKMRRIS